uniref:RNA 2',3'-cyclic phosphodiesterase n=1 Tax=Candidatus Kentrum sp. FM TaxID=2126340 RepID=A0A450TTY9_9GAMM|nr:MAG: 2'-5' RNA ligase [Candidatus Kentron sp. FM]VFJ72202.1 MAG: 2'-5' RNA ligase [Candidatus Kentron sp. FM]VFK19694.1 MAG: 2'-5' RNA ligase [Candidatus Kentron sp. FM]
MKPQRRREKRNDAMKPDHRRLFFALWPTEAVRRTLRALVEESTPSLGGQPVPAENLHVTLAFLGAVDGARQSCLEKAAGQIDVPPFQLRFDHLGSFPRARITWSGVSETPPALLSLVAELGRGVAGCGLEPERRPFTPHVTLARKAGKPVRNIPHAPVEWPVEGFCLAESLTLPTGARYRVLRHWRLGGQGRCCLRRNRD